MKLQNKFLLPVLTGAVILFLANSSDPPNAKTGAPFDGICSDCHGGGSFQGTVSVSGLPSDIMPNTTYHLTLTLTATSGSPTKGGFQIVAVNSSNVNIGDLINTGTETGTSNTGGREYLDHRGAKSFSGNSVNWTFDWKSPNGPNGAVITLYFAGNFANGNNSTSGDAIENASISGTLMGGGTPLSASISAKTNVSCFGGSNGSMTVTAAGGTSPYTYLWSDGSTNNPAISLTAGTYTVTVTDNGGSTATATSSISQPSQLQHTLTIVRNVTCPGGRDGLVSTNASGGTPPYTISYSGGSSSNLAAGMYSVIVTDANKCTSMSEFEIVQPSPYSIQTDIFKNPLCPSDSTGEISLEVIGATPPYKYKWNSGDTIFHIILKPTGSYKVTITDKNNCGIVQSYVLSAVDTSAPTMSLHSTTLYLDSNGSCSLQIDKVLQSLSDNCDKKPSVTLSRDHFLCSDLGTKYVRITAQDVSGNSKTDSVLIEIKDTLKPVFTAWSDTTFTSCNVASPKIQANDNCGIFSLRQTKGIPAGDIFPIGLTEMEFVARDSSGNEQLAQFKVHVEQPLSTQIDTEFFEICYRDTFHVSLALKNKNLSGFTFLSKGDSLYLRNDTVLNLKLTRPDSLFYTVRDSNNCQIFDTIIPHYPDSLIFLDTVIVKDFNATNGEKGSLTAIIQNVDSIAIYNDAGEYINNSGLNLDPGRYYIHAYFSSCEVVFGPFEVKLIIQTEQQLLSSCSVLPNPVYNQFVITKSESLPALELQVFNTQGNRLYKKSMQESTETIDVGSWPSGLYFLIMSGRVSFQSIKITKL